MFYNIFCWKCSSGSHHVDLRFSSKKDPDWLKQVRVKETRIIAHWLRQYYKDEAIGHA
jgi:lysosomal Pro-X carboxypeptidase